MTKKEKQLEAIRQKMRFPQVTPEDVLDDILAAEDDPPEPEIKPGELVRGWIGDDAFIGTLFRRVAEGDGVIDTGDGREFPVERIERFYMPFTDEDWKRFPNVNWVIDFDSTERFMSDSVECRWELEEKNRDGAYVVRILKRPKGR